jgi:hypothetical protein
MKRHEKDRLLEALLANEEVAQFRGRSLDAVLAAIRHRRRRRAALNATAAALALAVIAFVTGRRPQAIAPSFSAPSANPTPVASHVKFIDDAELLARFAHRGVALFGEPGSQRFVFLDGGENAVKNESR